MSVPRVGDRAPDFRGEATTGKVALAHYVGKKPLVLYFFPKADTAG